MLFHIALGGAMVVATTLIQSGFTILLVHFLEKELDRHPHLSRTGSALLVAAFVLGLFLAMVVQVWSWAAVYLLVGALDGIETAVYFSTVTFTTLGFGDITLDEEWRLLSSFEAANGLLMFGWSTALVFAAVQWTYDHRNGYKRAKGARRRSKPKHKSES